jgi:hypothetical protein
MKRATMRDLKCVFARCVAMRFEPEVPDLSPVEVEYRPDTSKGGSEIQKLPRSVNFLRLFVTTTHQKRSYSSQKGNCQSQNKNLRFHGATAMYWSVGSWVFMVLKYQGVRILKDVIKNSYWPILKGSHSPFQLLDFLDLGACGW